MPKRRSAAVQEPLQPFKDEIAAGVRARNEAQLRRIEHKRELSRERSRRYRANRRGQR